MMTLREQLLAGADRTVLLIQWAAGALLLLAILNLVSLLVAWGFERSQEMAVRLALGGGRRQVVRLLVAQSAIIVAAGLVVGVLMALAMLAGVRQLDLGPQLGFFLRQVRMDVDGAAHQRADRHGGRGVGGDPAGARQPDRRVGPGVALIESFGIPLEGRTPAPARHGGGTGVGVGRGAGVRRGDRAQLPEPGGGAGRFCR